MDIIINYLFIGVVFSFLLDYLVYKNQNHKSFKNIPNWTWKERILLILIWPLGLANFIYGFIKEYFRK